MPQAFLTSPTPTHSTNPTNLTHPSPEPSREKVTLTLRGSAPSTERVIHELYRVGFAEVREWSRPIPTGKVNEVMRVLTRWVIRG
jgi:hypothetical protein